MSEKLIGFGYMDDENKNEVLKSDVNESSNVTEAPNEKTGNDQKVAVLDSNLTVPKETEKTNESLTTDQQAKETSLYQKEDKSKVELIKDSKGKIHNPSDFVWSGDYLMDMNIEELPYLVNPIFPKSGLVALSGSSDTGKSSLLRQLAMSIVLKEDNFLGFPIENAFNRVVYVSTEDDRYAISMLMNKQNVDNRPKEEFAKLGYIFNTNYLFEKIYNTLAKHKVDCVIIDAFGDLYGDDMNASNKVRSYLQRYSFLADMFQCLFIFLHHTGKRTENLSPSKHNLLGSQGFEAKMRLVIELRRDLVDPSIVYLFIVKGNYLPEQYKGKGYKLRFDENMRFTNLNERIEYEDIFNPSSRENSDDYYRNKACHYKAAGKTVDEITSLLQNEGCTKKRSTIAKWIKEGNSNNKPAQLEGFDYIPGDETEYCKVAEE